MPPFMLSALALIARGTQVIRSAALGTPTRAALTGLGVGSLLPELGNPFGGGGGGAVFGPARRRRRRRRALTASDRADIGFITGLLGTTAGKNFALTIATRTG